MKSFLLLLCLYFLLIAQAAYVCDDNGYLSYLNDYPSKCNDDCIEYMRYIFTIFSNF